MVYLLSAVTHPYVIVAEREQWSTRIVLHQTCFGYRSTRRCSSCCSSTFLREILSPWRDWPTTSAVKAGGTTFPFRSLRLSLFSRSSLYVLLLLTPKRWHPAPHPRPRHGVFCLFCFVQIPPTLCTRRWRPTKTRTHRLRYR